MTRRNWFLGFGAGLLAGSVGTIAVTGDRVVMRAAAQAGQQVAPPPPIPQPIQPGEILIRRVTPAPAAATAPAAPLDPGVVAEGPPPVATATGPRYQISAWGIHSSPEYYGAFVIDTVTGQVWTVDGNGAMKKAGKVPAE